MTASLASTVFPRKLIFTGPPARRIGDHRGPVNRHTMQLPDCRQSGDNLFYTIKLRQQCLQDQFVPAQTAHCNRGGIARTHPSEINTGKNRWQSEYAPALNDTLSMRI